MRKIKVVQIGIGHDHAITTFVSLKDQSDIFEIAGLVLCDGEEKNWESAHECYKTVPKLTLREALDIEDLDAAIIESEDFDLTRYAMMFAERGVHIHMDKPGGVSQEDYERMLSIMKSKNLVFHTGYMYRYNPVIMEKLAAARRGDFGEIYSVEAHMDCFHQPEKRAWLGDYPGGMMHFLGCHLVDLILLFQGMPEEIIPFNCSTGFDGVSADDYGMAVFKYKNGVSFAKTCAYETGGFLRRQLVICGKDATVEIKPLEEYPSSSGFSATLLTRWIERRGGGWHKQFPQNTSEPFVRMDLMMRSFAEYVLGVKTNPYTYEYEARLHRVLLAACGVDIDYKAEIKL